MIASLHIETALRDGITYLQKSYCTTPFKVANITEDKKDKTLRLMLMSSSPGILDGDEYHQKIEVAEGCVLELQTQSYQRLFNMKKGARQHLEVHQSKGSSFLFLPYPSVPHEASSFSAINKFFISENCSLIFGEILTCGRKLSGEAFLFSKYHNVTEIHSNKKLIIKENLLMQPATININAIGQLEGYTHQASLIYLNETADCESLYKTITDYLSEQKEIIFGITTAPVNGLIVRILGQKGEQLHNCLKTIAGYLPQTTEKLKRMQSEMWLLLVAAVSIACLHTGSGPDHYLPFIALSRSRGWSYKRTLSWTIICGCGHVWSSVLIGLGGAAIGWSLSKSGWLQTVRGGVAGWVMLVFGFCYAMWGLYRAYKNKPHKHFDMYEDGEIYVYEHKHGEPVAMKDRHKVTPWVMFIIFLLGPCEPMIPLLYFPAAERSLWGMGLLIIVYTLATLLTMFVMVTLGYLGIAFVKTEKIERYVHALGGLTIFICGFGMVFMRW